MPHFRIDCSEPVLSIATPEEIIDAVHDTAEDSELFRKGDIKVRIVPFSHYSSGGTKDDFIHITADIMGGRSTEQKQLLSRSIVARLKPMFSSVQLVSIDIRDIDPETYTNLAKL